jgi:hypothetical protein
MGVRRGFGGSGEAWKEDRRWRMSQKCVTLVGLRGQVRELLEGKTDAAAEVERQKIQVCGRRGTNHRHIDENDDDMIVMMMT